jgi:RNA polymerase sigma factor (sigma-70 family)
MKMPPDVDRSFPRLAELKAGSNSAWTAAFAHLWPIAIRSASSAAEHLSAEDAEEAASDAIQSAVEQIDDIRDVEQLAALVAVIARRRAIMIIREKFAAKRAPGGVLVYGIETEELEKAAAVVELGPDYDAILAETATLVQKAMESLDTANRRLLNEKFLAGYSYEELSEKYGAPVGTLCSKVMRALEKVRQTLRRSPRLMQELKDFLR